MYKSKRNSKRKGKEDALQTVCGWGVCWVVLETIFSRSLTICMCLRDQIQNLQNCLPTPRQKSRMGGGLKQITICRKVLLLVTFKTKRFCIVFYESYLLTTVVCILSRWADGLEQTRRKSRVWKSSSCCLSWMASAPVGPDQGLPLSLNLMTQPYWDDRAIGNFLFLVIFVLLLRN